MIFAWIYLGIGVVCALLALSLHAWVAFQSWRLTRLARRAGRPDFQLEPDEQFTSPEIVAIVLVWPIILAAVIAKRGAS